MKDVMMVRNPEFTLEPLVQYAIDNLAPLIGLDTSAIITPQVRLAQVSAFICKEQKVLLNQFAINDSYGSSLAHETTHFLHYIVNPSVFEQDRKNKERTNLREMVADYGSFIFAVKKHDTLIQLREHGQRTRESAFQRYALDEPKKTLSDQINYYETHEGGRRAAEYIFTKYGNCYFKDFAHASFEEAKTMLKNLGWEGPLLVRYGARDVEYMTFEKEEDILIVPGGELEVN